MGKINFTDKDHIIAMFMAQFSLEDGNTPFNKEETKRIKDQLEEGLIIGTQKAYGGVDSPEFNLLLEEGAVTPFIIAHELGIITDERLEEVRKEFVKTFNEVVEEEKQSAKGDWIK